MPAFVSAGFSENDDVLPRKEFQRFLEDVSLGLNFAANLFESHLVLGLDGNLIIFTAKFDQYQPAAWFESLEQSLQCDVGFGALVVNVDHQNQVDRGSRKLGVGLGGSDRLDICHAHGSGVVLEHSQHLGLHVGCQHGSGRSHATGEPDAVIACTAPTSATVAPDGIARASSMASGSSSLIRVSRNSQSTPSHDITSAMRRPM